MKCKKCKSRESTIHVANVGDFCLDCHNDLSEEVLGKDTVLRRVSINPDVIIEHFERSLSWFL